MSDTTTEKTIRPFSCGSMAGDWMASNCDRCTKGALPWGEQGLQCPIQDAVMVAWFEDGTVTPEIARRMGHGGENNGRYVWQCGEADWTEEWKAEWRKRHPETEAAQ